MGGLIDARRPRLRPCRMVFTDYPTEADRPSWADDPTGGVYMHVDDLVVARDCVVGVLHPFGGELIKKFPADKVVLTPDGLCIYSSRTNLFKQTEAIDQAEWTKSQCTVSPDVHEAPDSTQTMDKQVENAVVNQYHYIKQIPTFANSTVYSFGMFQQAGGRSISRVYVLMTEWKTLQYNLSTIVSSVIAGTLISHSCEQFGDADPEGYVPCRCELSFLSGVADAGTHNFELYLFDGASLQYTGDGVKGIHSWGFHLEAASKLGPYIPATTGITSSVAPVYYSTRTEVLRRLSGGRIDVSVDFTIDEDTETDIGLLCAREDNDKYLDMWLAHDRAGGFYRLAIGSNVDVATGALTEGTRYRATFRAYPDSSYFLQLIDLDAGTENISGSGTGLNRSEADGGYLFAGLDCDRCYIGCLNDESGQGMIKIQRIEVR